MNTPAIVSPEEWAAAKIRLEVDEMERLARERGFRAYYTLVPPRGLWIEPTREEDVHEIDWVRKSHARLREILAPHPNFIDLDFEGNRDEIAERYYASGKADPNPPGDKHLNEAGYYEIARRIARRVITDEKDGAGVQPARP